MIHSYECTQCGSTDFEAAGMRKVRCAYCGSLFALLTGEPKVSIQHGANVIFGRSADVEIHGDIEIEDGANVDVQGKISIVKGNQKQVFKLKLIRASGEAGNGHQTDPYSRNQKGEKTIPPGR